MRKHPCMRTKFFNDEYLTPLLSRINKLKKICLFLGGFTINLLNSDTKPEASEFYDNLSLEIIFSNLKHLKTF